MRNPKSQRHALTLRRRMTDAERHLWHRLRARQLGGHKFRRQHPVGPFVADFACIEAGLIVEVDGGQHGDQRDLDEARTRYLMHAGFRVLRLWNHEVLTETEACLELILRNLSHQLGPPPLAGETENDGRASDESE